MGKLVQKYLLAFLVSLLMVQTAHAAKTKFTNVEVTGTLDVDGAMTTGVCSCSNISTATLTSVNAQISTATFSGSQPVRFGPPITSSVTVVPAALNILAVDASHNLYISTATTTGGWVKVGVQN